MVPSAQTTTLIGTIWDYEGENFGYRVAHYYFPHSGVIIALALNSATGNDDIGDRKGRRNGNGLA